VSQIKTILFDLGNVLAYIDFQAFWRELGFFREEEIAVFKEGYDSLTLRYETGHIPTGEYLDGLRIVFDNKFTNKQLELAFASIIQKPVEGISEIVKRLSVAHQTALVSNTNEIHYKLSLEKFDVLKFLHVHYLSYRLQVMKPARGFYDAIIKDQGVSPSRMLFIDDIEENVEAAKKAGMTGLKFAGILELESSLKKLAVL
jgi:glucose-1-phosphatase